jgi:hypothetical protein
VDEKQDKPAIVFLEIKITSPFQFFFSPLQADFASFPAAKPIEVPEADLL